MAKKKLPQEVKVIQEHVVPTIDYASQKSISYSQYSQYKNCKYQWYLNYPGNHRTYTPSIHTVFGTALHETVQDWLTVLYTAKVKDADEINLAEVLLDKMRTIYKQERESVGEDFTTPEELSEFWRDGIEILSYLKRKRREYFSTKNTYLVGVEIPIVQELKSNVFFKGYIDLVFYNTLSEKYTIIDIKTSTKGWTKYQKKDDTKISQLLLYKEFFARQFNVPVDNIEVQYFIVKRKVPDDPEFPAMGRRVQEFAPPSGKIKRGQAITGISEFVQESFSEEGGYNLLTAAYPPSPSKNNCRFCPFKDDQSLCSFAVS